MNDNTEYEYSGRTIPRDLIEIIAIESGVCEMTLITSRSRGSFSSKVIPRIISHAESMGIELTEDTVRRWKPNRGWRDVYPVYKKLLIESAIHESNSK